MNFNEGIFMFANTQKKEEKGIYVVEATIEQEENQETIKQNKEANGK